MIATRILVVGSAKLSDRKRKPRIRIAGFWLEELGFLQDVLVAGSFSEGKITLSAQGTGVKAYRNCVRDVRAKNGCIMQVRSDLHNKKRTPHFELTGLWLQQYGFNIGDIVVLRCFEGLMTVTRLEIPE